MNEQKGIVFTVRDLERLDEVCGCVTCLKAIVGQLEKCEGAVLEAILQPVSSRAHDFFEEIESRFHAEDESEDLHIDTADFQRRLSYVLEHAPARAIREVDRAIQAAAEQVGAPTK